MPWYGISYELSILPPLGWQSMKRHPASPPVLAATEGTHDFEGVSVGVAVGAGPGSLVVLALDVVLGPHEAGVDFIGIVGVAEGVGPEASPFV
jgi:hypothetical protein